MAPVVLESPTGNTATAQAARQRSTLPTDAILSLDQAAELLGETLRGVRDLISVGLLKHRLIDGERCVWLRDLISYKCDFEKGRAEWRAVPLNQVPDDLPNPFDVIPEYAQMLEP